MGQPSTNAPQQQLLGWPRVMGLAFTHFYQHIIMVSLPPILTLIQTDFGVSYTGMGLLLSVSRFSGGVLQLPAGIAVDRLGKKLMLLLGFGLMLVSVFFAGLAPTFLILIFLQMMVGVADSVFHPATYSLVAQGSHPKTLGRSMSIHTTAGFAGTYLAMPLIARLGDAVGWRSTLMFLPIPGLLLMLALGAWFREPPTGIRSGGDRGASGPLFQGPLAVIFFASLLGGISMQGMIAFLPTFLNVVHGLSLVEAGDLAGLLLVGVVSMMVGGWLSDRVDRVRMVTAGAVVSAVMLAVLALWSPSRLLLSMFLVATGVAVYFTAPGYTALISSFSSSANQGRLFGMSFAGSALGSSLGVLLVGLIADVSGLRIAFVFLAAISVVRAGLVASLRRFRAGASEQAVTR